MGLDQYIYRIRKPQLEERTYTSSELSSLGLSFTSAIDFETNTNLYKSLTPYTTKRDVQHELYDTERMIADYNLPSNSYIWYQAHDSIQIAGTNENGERINQVISHEDVENKYIKTEIALYYIWEEDEEWYWRKNWDLVDWLEHTMKKPIENCGYYKLNKTLIHRINSKFDAVVAEESATTESAPFYWMWY